METIRDIALRTYKNETEHGMIDNPMNWHIWKRAFDTAEAELKKLINPAIVNNPEQDLDECEACGS